LQWSKFSFFFFFSLSFAQVAKSIKAARNFGLMPHIGEFATRDARPDRSAKKLHESIGNTLRVVSKTIV
jgi:hypothetical protein